MTVEIESILINEELAALLDAAEPNGQLRQQDLVELLEPLELDPLELEAVYTELDRRGIELVTEEPEKEPAPPPQPAVVQPADGVEPGPELEEELTRFCRERIAGYKVPRSFDFVEELPRDPNGKLYKRTLRDPYWAGRERAI